MKKFPKSGDKKETQIKESQWHKRKGTILGCIVLLLIFLPVIWVYYHALRGSDNQSSPDSQNYINSDYYDLGAKFSSVYDVIDCCFEEFRYDISGYETIEACYENGNCYTLEADISSGSIDTIYFPNGGWLDFYSAEIDSEGFASDYDDENRYWEFQVDTVLIENAAYDWASANGYQIE